MDKAKRNRFLVRWLCVTALLLAASLLVGPAGGAEETVQETMRDAVLHETNQIGLFGLGPVNPGLVSGFVVTAVLLLAAAAIRIFFIPRFQYVPGRFQLLLEQGVGLFSGMARSNSPWRCRFLGPYIFAAGVYIFFGTLFELFGFQAVATSGHSIALPAPLSDINGAIMLGVLSYLVIFGALLSGLLVTELVYYYFTLSFVLPVAVAVAFTLLHAVIQAYVLTLLTALFYGEMSEPIKPKKKKETPSRRRTRLAQGAR